MEIKMKRLRESARLPQYATAGAAAADLSACIEEPIVIPCRAIAKIPTGIAMEGIPGFAGLVFGRSGLGTKYGVTPANSVGVIDSDYRGEICVSLINLGTAPYTVEPGDRIAQPMIVPVCIANFMESETLGSTERGTGGFGSTGNN